MKKLNKIIASVLTGVVLSSSAYARPNVEAFISEYQNILQIMLGSYKEKVKEPLDARIFDISKPQFYKFLTSSTKQKNIDDFLAMMFYNDFKVNQKTTNFCFILFDGKKMLPLDRYLNSTFSKPEDAIYYLAAHEFAHCIAAHQRNISKIAYEPDPKKEEQIADMFSIAFFITRDQKDQALSIIRQNTMLNKEDIHYNPKELKKFYVLYNEDPPKITDMAQLFEVSYGLYLKIQNEPDLLEEELKVAEQEIFKSATNNLPSKISLNAHSH